MSLFDEKGVLVGDVTVCLKRVEGELATQIQFDFIRKFIQSLNLKLMVHEAVRLKFCLKSLKKF